MWRQLIDLIRLGRPFFLLGGFILYALGAMVARMQGFTLDWRVYWMGQLSLTSIQLMTHYLNDYWDAATDAANQNRTPFSGGSGVLGERRISPQAAFGTGLVFLAVGLTAFFVLALGYRAGGLFVSLYVLIFLGAFFYSAPPVNLAASGFGEFTTSLIVAGMLPMAAYVLQAHRLDFLVVLATLPLVLLHFAMLLAFELPDYESDLASGKRTLVVRLGKEGGIRIHNLLIVLAALSVALGPWLGLPWQVALGTLIALPLALVQLLFMYRLSRGKLFLWSWLTFVAVSLFGITAYLEALGFWALGNVAGGG